jgi:hypothetical protein
MFANLLLVCCLLNSPQVWPQANDSDLSLLFVEKTSEDCMENHEKEFHFFVDGTQFETHKPALTGAEIKQIAGVNASYQLFLEDEGETPDKPIGDSESISLGANERHRRHFFAVPPATFGTR